MRAISAILLSAVAVSVAPLATAQQFAPHASLSLEYSDNPLRLRSGERAATVLDGLLGFNVFHDGTLLSVDADVTGEREQSLSGDVPNQTLPNGYVDLVGRFVPDMFTWSVQDNAGQVSNQPFDALAAASRETVNVFSTGPDLLLPVGDRNHLVMRLRYGTDTFTKSNIDNTRYDGLAGLARDLSSASRVSVNYDYRKIVFREDQFYPSTEIKSAFLRYNLESGRTQIVAEGGWESLRFGELSDVHTPHALLALERRLSPRLTLTAEYTHGYADVGQSFVSGTRNSFTVGSDQNVQLVPEPSGTDSGYVTLSRTAGRARLSLEIMGTRESYHASPLFDRRTYRADLAVNYRLSSLLTLNVSGGWYSEHYTATDQQDGWAEGSVSLVRQLGEALSISLELARTQGSGSVTNRFREDRAAFTISYDPAATRREHLFDSRAAFRFYEEPTFGSLQSSRAQ